jgi:hypothetical protein
MRRPPYLAAAFLLMAGRLASAQIPSLGPLTIATATAGSQPNAVTGTTNYSATVAFAGQMRVSASLDVNMPANTSVTVKVTAPSGGTSLGTVTLGTTAHDVVIAATPVFFTNVTLFYTFTGTVAAGVLPLTTRTATYTLLTYP